MNQELPQFLQFKEDFMDNINKGEFNNNRVNEFLGYLSQITKNGALSGSLEQESDSFINEYCVKIGKSLISINASRLKSTSLLNKLLDAFATLFVKLISSKNGKFVEEIVALFENRNASCYSAPRSGYFYDQGHYYDVIRILNQKSLYDSMNLLINEMKSISLQRISACITVLDVIRTSNPYSFKIDDIYSKIISVVSAIIDSLEKSSIRDIDEKLFDKMYNQLCNLSYVSGGSYFNAVVFLYIPFWIKVMKAGFLSKTFWALTSIGSVLSKHRYSNSQMCQIVANEKFVDIVLVDFHHKLVPGFISVVTELQRNSLFEMTTIKSFWKVSCLQHKNVMGDFFKGWSSLVMSLSQKQIDYLYECIIEEDKYFDEILHFLMKMHRNGKFPSDNKIFYSLSSLSLENESSLIIEVTCLFIPKTMGELIQIQSNCFAYLSERKHISYSIALLGSTLSKVGVQDAHKCFVSLFDIIQGNMVCDSNTNEVNLDISRILPLLGIVMSSLNEPLTDSEFDSVFSIMEILSRTRVDIVCSFVESFVGKKSLWTTKGMLSKMIKLLCSISSPYEKLFPTIKSLFEKLNQPASYYDKIIPEQSICIDDIWHFLYNSSDNSPVQFLLESYGRQNIVGINQYISRCFYCLNSFGSIKALEALLIKYKCVDKEKQNKYSPFNDGCRVELYGSLKNQIFVKSSVTYQEMVSEISSILRTNSYSITLKMNGEVLNERNFMIYDGASIEVMSYGGQNYSNSNPKNDILSNLSGEDRSLSLYSLLESPNIDIAQCAYNIMNRLPTVTYEKEMIMQETNYENSLLSSPKYLVLYRLNMIGNIINKNTEFLSHFISNKGSLCLFELFSSNSTSNWKSSELKLLFEITKMVVSSKEWEKFGVECINESIIEFLISTTIDQTYFEFSSILMFLITKLAQIDVKPILISSKFNDFMFKSVFSAESAIRKDAISLIKMISIEKQVEIIEIFISDNQTKYCKDLVDYTITILNIIPDLNGFCCQILIAFSKAFRLPTGSILQKLEFLPPFNEYFENIIRLLMKMISSLPNLVELGNLLEILIDDIILCPIHYYPQIPELSELVEICMVRIKNIDDSLYQKLIEAYNHVKQNSSPGIKIDLAPHNGPKGLKNLGATCYINATLQQLFNIPLFRYQLLSISSEETWFNNLQDLFTFLEYSPSTYVDSSQYVQTWNGWDGVPINPREQQDAVEYLGMLFDRLETINPSFSSLFKGTIVHQMVGLSTQYTSESEETFFVFQVDVKGHNSLEESLKTFLIPDRFEGDNKYSVDQLGKIDAERRHMIKQAPQLLIIQLRRFEYNLEKGTREKINSEYGFPYQLDITSIMQDKDEKAQYELIGVQMHAGTSQSGHYFSHINLKNQWMTFNDETVLPIGFDRVLSESKGGDQIYEYYDEITRSYQKAVIENSSNAYLLYYKQIDLNLESHIAPQSSVLSRTINQVHYNLMKNATNSPLFNDLVLSSDHCNREFLLEFVFNGFRNETKATRKLRDRCLSEIARDPSISTMILSDVSLIIDGLLTNNSLESRKCFAEVISSAIISQKSLHPFETLFQDSKIILSNWRNIDTLFIPLIQSIQNNIPGIYEIVPTVLSLITVDIPRYSSSNSNESIMTYIPIQNTICFLNMCLNDPDSKSLISQSILNISFLLEWHASKDSSFELSTLLCSCLKNNKIGQKSFFSEINSILDQASISLYAYLVLLGLLLQQSNKQSFIEVLLKRLREIKPAHKLEIMKVMNSMSVYFCGKISSGLNSVIKYFHISYILVSDSDVRLEYFNWLRTLFPSIQSKTDSSNDRTSIEELAASFLSILPDTVSYYSDHDYGMFQYSQSSRILISQYFEFFSSVLSCFPSQNSLIASSSILISAMNRMVSSAINDNTGIISLFSLIIKNIGEQNSKSFFDHCSCDDFLSSLFYTKISFKDSPSLVSQLIMFLPTERHESFVKSKIFRYFCSNCLGISQIGLEVEHFINGLSDNKLITFISNFFWEEELLSINLRSHVDKYFSISTGLISKNSLLSEKFWKQNAPLIIMRFIIPNNQFSFGMRVFFDNFTNSIFELLSTFNYFFYSVFSKQTKFFGGSYIDDVFNKYNSNGLTIDKIISLIRGSPQDCGVLYYFLYSYFSYHIEIPQILYRFLNSNQIINENTKPETVKYASQLICHIINHFLKNRAVSEEHLVELYCREIKAIGKTIEPVQQTIEDYIEVYNRFSNQSLKQRAKITIISFVSDLMSRNINLCLQSSSIYRFISTSLTQFSKEMIESWVFQMYSMIKQDITSFLLPETSLQTRLTSEQKMGRHCRFILLLADHIKLPNFEISTELLENFGRLSEGIPTTDDNDVVSMIMQISSMND